MRLIIFVVAVLALGRIAAAQTCPTGCGMQKRACLQTARAARLACKLECLERANTGHFCQVPGVHDAEMTSSNYRSTISGGRTTR